MASSASTSQCSSVPYFCKYIHRFCNQTRLEGYDYCIRHILEDKSAPFTQCMFVNKPNKRRCTNAAPKSKDRRDKIFCPFHAKRAMLQGKITRSRKRKVNRPLAFLKSFQHYCPKPRARKRKVFVSAKLDDNLLNKVEAPVDFNELESVSDVKKPIAERAYVANVNDEASCIERFANNLDNAGTFTHKEVLTIAKEKILHLQQLYCEELKMVYHQLRENRRQFLAELQTPKPSQSVEQMPSEASFCALKQNHQHSGAEKIIRHSIQEKKNDDSDIAILPPQCTYSKNGKQCNNDVLESTNFCKNHILLDPNQLLFKACPFGKKMQCQNPVLVIDKDGACDLHLHRLLKSELGQFERPSTSKVQVESEPFQSMDDIASLGLDAIAPGSLFGLDKFGEPGESTDTVLSEDLMKIPLNPPAEILHDEKK